MGRGRGQEADAAREPLVSLVTALLGGLLALNVAVFLLHSAAMLRLSRYQLDYGEGPILQIALNVARGGPLYPPVDQPPYIIASYMPLYYLLCALGVRLTGPSFLVGRLLSILATLATALCSGLVVWDRTRHRFGSWAAGAMILAMPHFMAWGGFMRVDALALALATAGFWLFGRGRRWAGMALFALAPMARRTTLAGMAATFLREARQRGLRPAARLFAWQLSLLAGLVAAALAATRGGLYHQLYLHTATSVGQAWSWEQLRSLLWRPGQPNPLALWPGFFVVSAGAAIWSVGCRGSRDLLAYFLLAWLVFLTGGRIGSSHNYLLEPTAVGAMLFGAMWGTEMPRTGPRRAAAMLLGGVLAAQLLWTLLPGNLPRALSVLRPRFSLQASERVIQRIAEAPGPVLCEDTGLSLMAGREPPLMPFEFTMMTGRGALDPEPVYQAVREGRFALIVLRFNPQDPREMAAHRPGESWKEGRWPDGIIRGVQERYRLEQELGPYFLFVPRPGED